MGYKRQMPNRFTQERDDRLMNSLIQNYALEMKDEKGLPSGHFFLDKDAAKKACKEVIMSHWKYDEAKAKSYIKSKFGETWTHFDVNNDGLIEVERMPQFLRWFLGNSLDIDLQ